MVEFRSKLEDIMVTEELRFNPTPSFGQYKPFLEQAIPHPAKMNTKLLKFLIEEFTKEGDTVLDPMCGSGSTGVVASLLNRNAVQVDIEKKFVDWAEEARRKIEAQATLTPKGSIRNICGDSRKLSKLLKEADVVVTSPPYGEAQDGHGIAKKGYQGKKHSPTDLVGNRSYMPNKFENEKNISRLKYDAVITSPPYAETYVGGGDSEKRKERLVKAGHNPKDFLGGKARNAVLKHYSEVDKDEENISNLPLGEVDAVITSPPYARDKGGEKGMLTHDEKRRKDKTLYKTYGKNPENIDNLPFVDTVITSPPYEDAMSDKRHTLNTERQKQIYREKHWTTQYGEAPRNIGRTTKETYLEAMLQVYSEMFKVLKPKGKAIIVIKPFIRNKQVVDLPYHTWLLLERAGFKLVKLYKLRLKQDSFWRILYRKKYPRVPEIKHEYVIVTQK